MSPQENSWVMDPFEVLEVEKSLNSLFGVWLKDRSVKVTASCDGKTTYVHVVVKNESKSFYYPIEARIDMAEVKNSAEDVSYMILDYISSYLDEFFKEDENVFLPIDWSEFEVEGNVFQLKGQVQNLLVEDLADQLLSGEFLSDDALRGVKLGEY